MKNSKASLVYARALLESAAAGKVQDKVSADMRLFLEILRKLPALKAFLTNPIMDARRKASVIEAASGKLAPLTQKFLGLLAMKNRLPLLFQIAEEYLALEERQLNILRATIQSAQPLDKAQMDRLAKDLGARRPGKTYILTNQIDPTLIAGLRIQEGDIITDASIRHKLDLLRQKLAA